MQGDKVPVAHHLGELRQRLFISTGVIVAGAIIGFSLRDTLTQIIQNPLGQTLYYTSPAGGLSFTLKISLTFGLLLAMPVVVYHVLGFIAPATNKTLRNLFGLAMVWSLILVIAGVSFAYFISLPAALHFLTNFSGKNVQSLITADEYFNFALAYIFGFALLFQLPLIVWLINKITLLKPRTLMKKQGYVVLGSFIVAAILTPTPDPVNQALMAVPIILLYQAAILIVIIENRLKPRD